YALWPLLRIGYRDELQRFFEFCRRGLSADGFLMHKYQSDGAIGSSWHPYVYAGKPEPPIQEDETALVLFLCGQYYQHTDDEFFLKHYYSTLIKPMAHFLTSYIDHDTKLPHASYDLWEEKFLTSTYTTAVVYSALEAAAELAEKADDKKSAISWQAAAADMKEAAQTMLYNKSRKYFYKGLRSGVAGIEYDETIDISSFYGTFMFGLFPLHGEEVEQSYATLCKVFNISDDPNVVTPMPRYEHDRYNAVDAEKGNPWFITTIWLAQYYLETHQDNRARSIMRWVRDYMLPTGVLSEQLDVHSGKFISVAPLTWSQAEFMNALLDMSAAPEADATGS
ncbi:MAG: glycoside hydrolase family 15 protein, partial [Candidatus Binatia bacterium]